MRTNPGRKTGFALMQNAFYLRSMSTRQFVHSSHFPNDELIPTALFSATIFHLVDRDRMRLAYIGSPTFEHFGARGQQLSNP